MVHEVAHDQVVEILLKAGPVEMAPGADRELEQALQQALKEFALQGTQYR